MCEFPLTIDSQQIVATQRKLKAVWSREAAEDLRQFHNIDAEAELTNILAKELQAEIDREILEDLNCNLDWNTNHHICLKIHQQPIWNHIFDNNRQNTEMATADEYKLLSTKKLLWICRNNIRHQLDAGYPVCNKLPLLIPTHH